MLLQFIGLCFPRSRRPSDLKSIASGNRIVRIDFRRLNSISPATSCFAKSDDRVMVCATFAGTRFRQREFFKRFPCDIPLRRTANLFRQRRRYFIVFRGRIARINRIVYAPLACIIRLRPTRRVDVQTIHHQIYVSIPLYSYVRRVSY